MDIGRRPVPNASELIAPPTRGLAGFGTPEQLSKALIDELDDIRALIRKYDLLEARERIERALEQVPESFTLNAVRGEILYRLGLFQEASAALFTALIQEPTSWQNYQLVNHLYQESRAYARKSFKRTAGAPPPRPVELAIRAVARRFSFLSRFRRLEAVR